MKQNDRMFLFKWAPANLQTYNQIEMTSVVLSFILRRLSTNYQEITL